MTFRVNMHPGGQTFQVDEGESVLDAAMRQGIELPYGCRGGSCGSCAGQLLEGQIVYGEEPPGLTDAMREQKQALFCMAMPVSDLTISIEEVDALKGIPVRNLRCRAEQIEKLNHDVISMKLKLAGTDRLQYLAGQYIEFLLDDGKRRAFSIANAPHNDDLIELHIRHVPGGQFTDFLFDDMNEKTMLRMEGPLGGFYIREDSQRPIIMMGGGTGFGPLKAMIEHANYIGLERNIHLFMGVRALRDLYMDDMVQQWIQENPRLLFTPVLSEPMDGDNWEGETGFVHEAVIKTYNDLSPYEIYMSGPPPMVNAALEAFVEHGADTDHMYSDAFEFAADTLKAIAESRKNKES